MPNTRKVARVVYLTIFVAAAAVGTATAQSGVGLEIKEVSDSRSRVGQFGGNLQLKMVLTGSALEKIGQSRVLVKSATDDKGNDLWKGGTQADFQSREWNQGEMSVTLRNPSRAAKSLRIAGTVELFVPSKDPNAVVKVDKLQSKLDKPLSAKALKAEKLSITILSPAAYAKKQGENKLDDAKIAEMRAEAKKQGASDEEIDAGIALVQAIQELGGGTSAEGSVILAGKEADLDRVLKVRLLKADGSEISIPSSSSSTSGDDTIMVIEPSEPPPQDATLELTILTKKATMSVPYDLKNIELP